MPEIVTRHRVIHRDDEKAPRQDIAPGTRINMSAEHVNHLVRRGAAVSPRQAEREERAAAAGADLEGTGIAARDPGQEAEARAAEAAAARATGGENVSREQPQSGAEEL